MSGAEFLRALLVLAGVLLIGQGLIFVPAATQLADFIAEDTFESFVLYGRVVLPLFYGASLVAFSGPISRRLMPGERADRTTGIAAFSESLLGVAGIVIVGLAIVELASISMFQFLAETAGELSGRHAAETDWYHWFPPTGRLFLGIALVASRFRLAGYLRSTVDADPG